MVNEARKKTKKNKSCNIICLDLKMNYLDRKSLNWLFNVLSFIQFDRYFVRYMQFVKFGEGFGEIWKRTFGEGLTKSV